jgi:hypothetical protein
MAHKKKTGTFSVDIRLIRILKKGITTIAGACPADYFYKSLPENQLLNS